MNDGAATIDLIHKINSAKKIEDILDITNLKDAFRGIMAEIHPDKCKLHGASDAAAHLNELRDKFENGTVYIDELGEFRTNGYWIDYKSKEKALNWSFENWRMFKDLKDAASENFKKYIPSDTLLLPDGTYQFLLDKRAVPLSAVTFPSSAQEHVNWIFSRLLEYCAYLAQVGFVHCGLNPESVFIVPETHGIQICSFYHLTRIGNRVKTISGKYRHWYPHSLFVDKIAESSIDLELAQKIAIYLLGDKSGVGIILKKARHVHEGFLDFVMTQHENPYQTFHDYREFLADNFENKFYPLEI